MSAVSAYRSWFFVLVAGLCCAGCKSLETPEPPPSIADTDQTLSAPMRNEGQSRKLQWWEFENILDPRSREIERNLGY